VDAGGQVGDCASRFIRFNCGRNVYARKELQHGEAKEISTWYLSEDNLNPDSRGWMVFDP